MAKISLDPYLFFKGNAKEAMAFYKSVFGGELSMQTMGDVPSGSEESKMVNDSNRDQIMHARLETDGFKLFAGDTSKASPQMKKIALSLGGSDETKLRQLFDALADGGKVLMPLQKQFWGDQFGWVADKYGVEWMINISAKKE